MAYKIDPRKTPASEFRRIAREQTAKALEDLAELELRESAHEARKRMKKIRALLRLYRPRLGGLYRRENARFRDLARELAPIRNATTLLEALDALESSSGENFHSVRSRLEEHRERIEHAAAGEESVLRARRTLETALSEIAGWRLVETANSMPQGLGRTYRRGRDAMRQSRAGAGAEIFHEWRKRAKYHRHHCRLLAPVWERPVEAREREAHDLTDLLGERHDLSELVAIVVADGEQCGARDELERLLQRCAKRQVELDDKAFRLGAKLYTEKPKAILGRMKRYWCVLLR